jgi:hypothetical protein
MESIYKNYNNELYKERIKSERKELLLKLFSTYESFYNKEPFNPVFSQRDFYVENIMYNKETKK